jgi:hypothetical protein
MGPKLTFTLIKNDKHESIELKVKRLLCIGYSGRNTAMVEKHIEELAEIGVPRPNTIPAIYDLGTYLATQSNQAQVIGDRTSGEIEFALIFHENAVYFGVSSDHTDRELEKVRACPA